MKRTATAALIASVLVGSLTACQAGSRTPGTAPTSAATTAAAAIDEHESGPQSPIAFGLAVPRGATQLGPLARYRSVRLIEAYTADLDAAMARRGVSDARRLADANPDGVAQEIAPTSPPVSRPAPDSFALLEDPPRPDTTVSLMRIDGDPTDVVQRMAAQIAALLPDAGITPDELPSYCELENDRVAGCVIDVTGTTANERDIRVTMTVDPGDVATRTAPPSSLTKPVMELRVEYTGDPRLGQEEAPEPEGSPADAGQADPAPSTIVWPKMDLDAPQDTELLNGWTRPDDATMLLSGFTPSFASIVVKRGREADAIAREFAASLGEDVTVTKDVVEELNEVRTTYTSQGTDGDRAVGTYVLSARGNYVMLFYLRGQGSQR